MVGSIAVISHIKMNKVILYRRSFQRFNCKRWIQHISEEIESVLRQYKGIRDVAVIGVPNEEWGESVVAVIVMKELKEEELRNLYLKSV